jgi:mono/diheme cytochrome c family protein
LKKIIVIAFLFFPITLLLLGQSKNIQKKNSQPKAVTQKAISPGEKVYKKYCISCHQADAGGVPNLNPPLINTTYVLGDKTRLIKIILNGLNENIEIDGEFFSNPMPSLKILKDQEIADVLTYVRSNFGNKASSVTAAEVKAVRSKTK